MHAVGKFIDAVETEVATVEQSKGGVFLTGEIRTTYYEVVSVGDNVKEVKVGDKLVLGESYKGEKVRIENKDHFFFPFEVVVGVY